jgi:inosose dehydratase
VTAALLDRLAGAPISWGVCEVPDWGCQLPPQRVLGEMRELGLCATELGPAGYLAASADELAAALDRNSLRLAAAFVAAVLHVPERRAAALAELDAVAGTVAAAGAGVLVVAAAAPGDGYDRREALDRAGWAALAGTVAAALEVADRHGLTLAVHPHAGTLVEGPDEVDRLLELTDAALCLDTGHLSIGGSDPLQVAALAGPRVRHVHLKDVDAALAGQVRRGELPYGVAVRRGLYRPLGDGDVDVAGLVRALEGAGYAGWYVLEQDTALSAEPPAGFGPMVDVRRSQAFFEAIGRSIGPRPAARRTDG